MLMCRDHIESLIMIKKNYFVTIVDDHSRHTWICLIHSKGEVIVVLKDFVTLIRNQFALSVKTLRYDNDLEFFNSSVIDLLASHGIVHQSSCVYIPQEHKVIEKNIDTF